VYEKEADAKADPASLRQAEEAYTKGLEWLQKAGEGEKPITQRSRNRLLASIQNNLGVAQAKQGIRERSAAELKRAIASYEEARRSITSAPDPLLEPLLISNLAEAYYHLAEHEDRAENLKRARSFLSEALALPGTSNYPAIRGEVLYKFGEVDLALGDPRLGVHELACAFDIFDRAGRDDQARIVLKTMRLLPTPTVQRLLGDKTVSIAGCRWDEAKLMQRLLSL
jgi:tetratricopeptide (TPR) repeat protein